MRPIRREHGGWPKCLTGDLKTKVEPTTGIEPVNLFLTKEVLYQLSYVGMRNKTRIVEWVRRKVKELMSKNSNR